MNSFNEKLNNLEDLIKYLENKQKMSFDSKDRDVPYMTDADYKYMKNTVQPLQSLYSQIECIFDDEETDTIYIGKKKLVLEQIKQDKNKDI